MGRTDRGFEVMLFRPDMDDPEIGVFGMWLFDIKVERISLGALIIAIGMLVDKG